MTSPKDIFLDAIDLAPEDRRAFVVQRCGGKKKLVGVVMGLLEAHIGTDEVFGHARAASTGLEPGDRIGPYELIEEIGEGGFAIVWRARQEEPIQRTVALKLLKPGLETRHVLARFEAERKALALMEHPGIAKVLDGGATETGRPWFAMELVDGCSITEYCDKNGLGKSERLGLVLEVCRAVQHAHQKGVVHRDLKPSNILVEEFDGRATAKVIDFGIAKATKPEREPRATLLTRDGQVVGTPAYMSPEQIDESIDVDTRADVYAIGALLYELLSGTQPFEKETLAEAGLAEMLRIIREVDPPRPSVRIGDTTHVMAREIRGDLDWIVMRCLEKDRERRYGSAGIVADEIQRHLGGEPVMAGPPDFAYRAVKFAKRHSLEIAFATSVAAILVVGTVTSIALMLRAKAAEVGTAVELAKFEQISGFYESILLGADPAVSQGKDTSLVLDILGDAERRVEHELEASDEVEATIRRAIGGAYRGFGEPEKAEAQFRRVLELRMSSPVAQLCAKRELGTLLMDGGRLEESAPLLEEAVEGLVRELGPVDERSLRARAGLGTLRRLQGEMGAAEVLYRAVLADWTRVFGEDHGSSIMSLNNLAVLLKKRAQAGDLDEAIELMEKAVDLERNVHSETHPDRLKALNNLGDLLSKVGRDGEAVDCFEEALAIKLEVLPHGHKSLLIGLSNLASLRQKLGQLPQAMAHFERALAMVDPGEDQTRLTAIKLRFNYGVCLDQAGELERAYGEYEACVGLAEAAFGPGSKLALQMEGSAAWQLVKLGRAKEAEPRLTAVLAKLRVATPSDTATLGVMEVRVGIAWRDLGMGIEAKASIEHGLAKLRSVKESAAMDRWIKTARGALETLRDD